MDLMLSGNQVLTGLLLLSCGLIIAIVLRRYLINRGKPINASESYYRKKYKSVDVLRNTGRNWFIGLGSSLAAVLLLMSWTTYDMEFKVPICIIEDLNEDIEIIPRTSPPLPKPPPPPPPPVVEVSEEPLEEIEEFPELPPIDDPVIEYEIPEPVEEVLPPPPPPPPIMEDDGIEEILPISEQMPLFGGCEDKACSDEKLIRYLSRNIRYPNQARDNNITGNIMIRYHNFLWTLVA